MTQGALRLLTGKPSDAVRLLTTGVNAFRLTGATVFIPWYLTYLATAYTSLNQYDDALRVMSEATEAVDRTNERWCEAEVARVAGEVALLGPKQDSANALKYFEHALCSQSAEAIRREEWKPSLCSSWAALCAAAYYLPDRGL